MIECTYNFFGVKRCSFEPRYDLGEPSMSLKGESTPDGFARMVEATKPKTYVYDICVSCGKTRKRHDDISSP